MPLPWFRGRKATAQSAPPAVVVPTVEPERLTPPPEPPAEAPAASGEEASPAKKRRRGSRGGRGRKKKPAAPDAQLERAAGPVSESAPATESEGSERKPDGSERKGRERSLHAPRRNAPRRAPLPKAKRELLVSIDPGEKRVAVLEDGVVAEVYLERPEQRSIAGNIYLGTVDNVLPGMEAAFVEIGLEKNGFLYVDEIVGPELEGRRGARKIQDLIQRGQTILVQAVKDPMKTKGARLTTEISLPGRFVVYVPHGDGLGASRRLDDDERNRLKAIVKGIAPDSGGVIVRTAAEGASAEDVARDLEFLCRLWETIEASAAKAQTPALIYQEAELPLRVTRDLFTGDFERLFVDHDRTYKRIVGYLKKTSPHMVDRVTRYREREPLLELYGVEQEIRSTLNRRVDLPSGGYLIFDYAEAFTVIDVNTGRFVGSRSKRNGPGRLEDTITKNNLEAVKEVVRQLRMRDVGGIIVIDFIDMANPKNRQQVEDALRQELERDRTKTYVVEISPLGLVEMTRQNVTDGPREVMTRVCPTCDGDGIVVSDGTAAAEVERRLRRLVTPGARAKAFKVELNAKVAALLVGPDAARLRELEEITKRRFFFVGNPDVHLDHLRVLEQGTVEKLAPAGPAAVGQELDLRLGEVGLYDPHAGVAKLDGIDVVVAEASKLVGKRVHVRVSAVMEGVVYASLVGPGGPTDLPITAEAEAERPMRSRRVPTRKDAAGASVEPLEEDDATLEEADAILEETQPEPLSETPPSRRRATRKAAPLAVREAANGGGPSEEVEQGEEIWAEHEPPGSRRVPTETQPALPTAVPGDSAGKTDAEGETGAAPAKRTRRGTRGGRNRKRKTPLTVAEGATVEGSQVVASQRRDEAGEVGSIASEPRRAIEPAAVSSAPVSSAPVSSAPVIHLPEPDLGRNGDPGPNEQSEAAPRSGARRGSRGGRGRRKTPALAASVELQPAESPEASPAAPSGGGGDEWEYTPMSEWETD